MFGAQTPWHDADVELAVTQACVPQSTGLPNWPPTHDCKALPEHWVLPAEQEPEHCPAVHAPLEQAAVAPHAPEGSHVWVPVPAAEHCTAPGAHTPWHAAPVEVAVHALFVQSEAGPQLPLALHVCTPLPEHCVEFGAQTPLQPPLTQASLPQSIGAPHCPFAPQMRTALPTQSVAAGVQPPPSAETSGFASPESPAFSAESSTVESLVPSRVASWPASPPMVASPGPVSADPSSLPPLLPGAPSAASGRLPGPVVLLPPHATTRVPAIAPAINKRIRMASTSTAVNRYTAPLGRP